MNLKNILAASAILLFASCSQPEQKAEPTEAPATEQTTPEETPEATTEATEPGISKVTVNADDQMKFDTKEIRVKAGSKVELTLHHIGKMDKKAMGHNLVIINGSMDLSMFAGAAAKAHDADYIPKGEEKNIIAHTKLLGGGESDTITFDAPEPGVYHFLCTFPGHWGVMNGKFIVE